MEKDKKRIEKIDAEIEELRKKRALIINRMAEAKREKLLRKLLIGTPESIGAVFREIEQATGISRAEIVNRSRKHEIVVARAILSTVLRDHGMLYTEIAKIQTRDHSTIMHQVSALEDWMSVYPEIKQQYEAVRDACRNSVGAILENEWEDVA